MGEGSFPGSSLVSKVNMTCREVRYLYWSNVSQSWLNIPMSGGWAKFNHWLGPPQINKINPYK